jgi:hypothetical protein
MNQTLRQVHLVLPQAMSCLRETVTHLLAFRAITLQHTQLSSKRLMPGPLATLLWNDLSAADENSRWRLNIHLRTCTYLLTYLLMELSAS